MSLSTRQSRQWLDIGTLNAKVYIDTSAMQNVSIAAFTPNGLGTAVLEVRKSYDGGVGTGLAYSVPKTLTIAAPVEALDVSSIPGLIVIVTTVGTASEKAQIWAYETAVPG